jgi:hypothetical protein
MSFKSWIHHLFNPHCPECEQLSSCKSCETLEKQLAQSNYEKEMMLRSILTPQSKEINTINETESDDISAIQPKFIPWNVRRQMLESEDRQKAMLLKKQKDEQKQAIEELEKRLEIVKDTTLDLSSELSEDADVQN